MGIASDLGLAFRQPGNQLPRSPDIAGETPTGLCLPITCGHLWPRVTGLGAWHHGQLGPFEKLKQLLHARALLAKGTYDIAHNADRVSAIDAAT